MAEPSNNSDDKGLSPGGILRAAREHKNLSTEDIAKRVHLERKIIEAIEADNYDGMASPIYVRGYLRSYAKTVDADAEKIIELYNAETPQDMPEILPEVKPPTQASSSDKPVKAFTYLISLGLVLLLLIWYQSNFVVSTGNTVDSETIEEAKPTEINGVDTTYTIVVHPEGWQSPVYDEPEPMIPEVTESIDTIVTTNSNETVLELQTDNNVDNLEIIIPDKIDDDRVVTGNGKDKIKLKLTSDSWIEIIDANNQKLFHDLGLANEQHIISGAAPFNVLLGFSPGVTIEFNGKPFTHSKYSNNGIARFTLPEQ